MPWIPVDERLPDERTPVLIWILGEGKMGPIDLAVREGNSWICPHDTWPDDSVTHWMPLPEPPEEIP